MQPLELKTAIKAKAMELEVAQELEKPHAQIFKIYKELKELQFQMVQKEISLENAKNRDRH